jgi:hypothetical protein
VAFLRLHDQDRWALLTRHVPSSGDPGDARRLLQRVVPAVDGALGYPHLSPAPWSLCWPVTPHRAKVRVYDPYARFGERGCCDSRQDIPRRYS